MLKLFIQPVEYPEGVCKVRRQRELIQLDSRIMYAAAEFYLFSLQAKATADVCRRLLFGYYSFSSDWPLPEIAGLGRNSSSLGYRTRTGIPRI
jgi:hypothetical protein